MIQRVSICLIGLCTSFGVLTSCSGPEPVSVSAIESGRSLPGSGVRARERDLDASVRFAAAEADMAVTEIRTGDGGERVYRLLTIRDEPAWVVVSGEQGLKEARTLSSITVRAKVGRFGDRRREQELVRLITDRLEELRERDAE